MGLECEAALWAFRALWIKSQSRERQHLTLSDSMSWVCASTKGRSSIWSVACRARELCGLCLASNASVRHRWNPADAPSRRFEWSSQYHARFRETSNSRLPRQCLLLDEFDASSADSHAVQRVETEKSLVALLGLAADEAAHEQRLAADRTVKAPALPPVFALDEHLNSASSPTKSKPRFSQPSETGTRDSPPGLDHGTAPLNVGFSGGDNKKHSRRAWRRSLVGWPARHYLTIGQRRPGTGISGMELRPGNDTGHGQQSAGSGAVGTSGAPATHVTKLPFGHRQHPGLETPSWWRAGLQNIIKSS